MKYYIAMFDGEPIAVSTKSRDEAWVLGNQILDYRFGQLGHEERTRRNAGKIFRVVNVRGQDE